MPPPPGKGGVTVRRSRPSWEWRAAAVRRRRRDRERRGRDLLGRGLEGNRRGEPGASKLGKPGGVRHERLGTSPDRFHDGDRVGLVLAEQAEHVGVSDELAHCGASFRAEAADGDPVG